MINDKHKFILILLPKTGTTSLSQLKGIEVKNNAYKHYNKLDDNQLNYLKVSTCRNPFSRVVSLWGYWNKRARKEFPEISFNYFVNNFSEMEMRAKKVGHKLDVIHFKSCIEGVRCSTYNKISYKDIDFWIKTENLQEDFNLICDKVGIPKQKLPHKNKTNHKHYTEYYDDEARSIVAEKYAKDIEYFGYKFGE